VVSAYGAASSLVVLLLWIYYSALIFFYGAAFSYVFSERRKTRADAVQN
jgi:membrane protein